MDIIFDEVDLESFKLEFCFFNEMIKNCIKFLQFGDLLIQNFERKKFIEGIFEVMWNICICRI